MLPRFLIQFALGFLLVLVGLAPQAALAGVYANPINVSLTILSKSNCQFNNPATATLNFGTLNPLSPADVSVSTTVSFVCRGSSSVATYSVSDDDGLHESGPGLPRMQHTTTPTTFLPYLLTLSPTTGSAPKNVDQILTVTGTILGTDYQSAIAGNYSDTVTISIQP